MKRKLWATILAACMAVTMLPTQVFAVTPQKLTTPTELQWNRCYDGNNTYEERIGFISWQIPENGIVADDYRIVIYKGNETIKETTYTLDEYEKTNRHPSLDGLNTLELSDGSYYFTVQAIGDGTTYENSDVSQKSEAFDYKQPSTKLDIPSNLTWNGDKISFSSPSDTEKVMGYEIRFFFGETENAIDESSWSSLISHHGASATEETISTLDMIKESVVDENKPFCRFRVRALSANINENQNSDWSADSSVKDLSDIFSGTQTFSLSYNLDGGTGSFSSQNYQAGATVTLPSTAPTKEGYTFKGWSDGSTTYQAGASFTMPSKAVTLTAQWSKDSVSISSATVTVNAGPHYYTGSAITPSVTVKVGETTLVKDTDYIVSYNNNIQAGTATVTVTGKGGYTGTASAEFTISKAELHSNASIFLLNRENETVSIDLAEFSSIPSGETVTFAPESNQTPTGFTPALSGSTLTLTANGSGTSSESYKVNGTSGNYTVTVTIQVTYTDKEIKPITPPAVTASVVYSGAPAEVYTGAPSISGESSAEFTATYTGIGSTTYGPSATAPTNVGTYTVTFALDDENGTLDFVANPVSEEFAITQATPVYTAPTTETLSAAKPLGEAALTGGSVEALDGTPIAGDFSWTGDGTANITQGQGYTWIFTPTADDANYDFTKVTGTLTPWPASSGGSGGGGGGSVTPPSKPTEPSEPENPSEPTDPEPDEPDTPPVTTPSFTDVPSDAYYADAVNWAVSKGITNGTGNGEFSPNASCTRADMVTFLWRAAGSPAPSGSGSFSDVPADAYYYDAVLWAAEQGITTGTGDGLFDPGATVTRAQTVTFLYRFAGSPDISGGSAFGDVASGTYYTDAVSWAAANGITTGTGDNRFAPADDCSRGQIVTFLFRQLAE